MTPEHFREWLTEIPTPTTAYEYAADWRMPHKFAGLTVRHGRKVWQYADRAEGGKVRLWRRDGLREYSAYVPEATTITAHLRRPEATQ